MATEDIRADWLDQMRRIALALPEAVELETWEVATFRVRHKMFAILGAGNGDGIVIHPDAGPDPTTLTLKAVPGEQESLLAQGHPFFRPRYVGHKGWIGLVIDDHTDWAEVEELVIDSYRTIAPKRLSRLLDT